MRFYVAGGAKAVYTILLKCLVFNVILFKIIKIGLKNSSRIRRANEDFLMPCYLSIILGAQRLLCECIEVDRNDNDTMMMMFNDNDSLPLWLFISIRF